MKRWPLLATFILFIALCVSAAFWVMQLFKPPVRSVAAIPQVAQPVVQLDAASSLFGGKAAEVVVATNFQLTGVVVAPDPQDSIAILVTDTKPPQSVRVNTEIMPGVTVKEVFKTHVLLLERGVVKRVDLPDPVKLLGKNGVLGMSPQFVPYQPPMPAQQPAPPIQDAPQAAPPQEQPQPQPEPAPAQPDQPQSPHSNMEMMGRNRGIGR